MPLTIQQLQEKIQRQEQIIQQQEKTLQEQKETLRRQEESNKKQELLLKYYEEQFRLLQKQRYGSKAEGSAQLSEQLCLFNEVELLTQPEEPEPQMTDVRPVRNAKKKKQAREKGERDAFVKSLPKVTETYTIPEDEVCPECGGQLRVVKKEIRKELEVIPAKVQVREIVRYVYRCHHCEAQRTAPSPQPLLRGSLLSPSLGSYVICRKYENRDPLNKISMDYWRRGLRLSEQTLSNWMMRIAEDYGSLLYERMKKELLSQFMVHADETPVQVLKEPGRRAQQKSYEWVFSSGAGQTPVKLYHYAPSRGGKVARGFLGDYQGYLQSDGYSAYHTLGEQVTCVGCFAHVRRKFVEALQVQPKGTPKKGNAAWKGVRYCNVLIALDERRKKRDCSQWDAYKQGRIRTVMQSMFAWAEKEAPKALSKSRLKEAFTYVIRQRNVLENYLLDGRLEITNNAAERAVKPFVMGRKNWMFCNAPRGAESSSILYSLVETAKANGLNPFEYLRWVLEQMRSNIALTDEALDRLLPWSTEVPSACRCSET